MHNRNRAFVIIQLWLAFLIALAASGCTVKLIADYDESTDKSVTALQRKLATFFVDVESKIAKPEGAHDKYVETYKELRVDISALELRVNALPKNTITQQQIALLKANLTSLELLHKAGFGQGEAGARAALGAAQKDFDTALAAILKLELAKKRGEQSKE